MKPAVRIGHVHIGGDHPVVIQSMTNTDTCDATATTAQILALTAAGSEIVRITIDCPEAAQAVPEIIKNVRQESDVPIVGDFHFNGHVLLSKYPAMAQAIDKYRINPGNVGRGEKRDTQFEQICQIAVANNKPVRIGVNGGSLDPELLQTMMDENAALPEPASDQEVFNQTMVMSAVQSVALAKQCGLRDDQIIVSAKLSEVHDMIWVYRQLSKQINVPLHLGLTEAGSGIGGIVGSSIALGTLLQEGIGATIRVSITPEKREPRTKEVEVCKEILQALGIRQFAPKITSCPGCGRTTGNAFAEFAETIKEQITTHMVQWEATYPYAKKLKIAVMGCIVNGPGEARAADIGIFFPGKGEGTLAIVYQDGQETAQLNDPNLDQIFLGMIEKYLRNKK